MTYWRANFTIARKLRYVRKHLLSRIPPEQIDLVIAMLAREQDRDLVEKALIRLLPAALNRDTVSLNPNQRRLLDSQLFALNRDLVVAVLSFLGKFGDERSYVTLQRFRRSKRTFGFLRIRRTLAADPEIERLAVATASVLLNRLSVSGKDFL